MATFNAGSIEATLDLDLDPFQRGLRYARAEGKKFAGETYAARATVDTAEARGQLGVLRAELSRMATGKYNARVGLDGGTATLTQLAAISGAANRIDGLNARARVDVSGVAQSLVEIRALREQLDGLSRSSTTTTIGAGSAASITATTSAVSGLNGGLLSAVFSMQGLVAAAILLAPALIPGILAATAALGGLVAAVSVATGGLAILGAAVIGNVMSVIGAHKQLEQANQQVASTAKGAQQAEQSLADARRANAQAVANAEYQVVQAQKAAQQAQADLNQARKDAAQQLADYRDQLKGAALQEEDAEEAVRRARLTLKQTMRDPTSTKLDRDEAQNAFNDAVFQLGQVRKSRDDLQKKAAQDRKAGVDGNAQVVKARQSLAAANQQVRRAEQGVAQARADGARQIAQAQAALLAATTASTAAQQAQADLVAKTSTPAARGLLSAVDALKGAWQQFLKATEGPALGLATQALTILADDVIPALAPAVKPVARAVSGLFDEFDRWAKSGGMKGLVGFIKTEAPPIITLLGHIIGNLAVAFGGVVKAFTPFAKELLGGFERITAGWAKSAQGLSGSKGFQGFLDYVRKNGPLFLSVLGGIGKVFISIGRALAPAAGPVLRALKFVLDGFNGLDPAVLRILLAVFGGILAFTVAPVAGTALAVVALVAAFSSMGDATGPLPDLLREIGAEFSVMWGDIKKLGLVLVQQLKDAWDRLKPSLSELATTLREDLLPAWSQFWDAAQPILRWFIRTIVPVLGAFLVGIVKGLNRFAKALSGALDFLTGVFTGDFGKAWEGIKEIVDNVLMAIPDMALGVLKTLGDAFLNSKLGRIFEGLFDGLKDTVRSWVGDVLDKLVRGDDSFVGRIESGFRTFMSVMTGIWNGLVKLVGTPVKIVVDTLYNEGIRPVVNAIPGVGDIGKVDTSGWPSFADGGVLPGHSPGRDIHKFVSPTGGILNLGGGEGILTTDAVDQLGGRAAIDRINKLARIGRLGRGREGSYAQGGVVYLNGEPLTYVAAAQLSVAERNSGIPMSVIQGSYQQASSYSGSTHTGGGVMDTGPGNFASQAALRKVGFAAWARNQVGVPASQLSGDALGSNMHVHSVSMVDPYVDGTASPQVAAYKAGQNGLGGPDYGPRPAVDNGQVMAALRLAQQIAAANNGVIKGAAPSGLLDIAGGVVGGLGHKIVDPLAKFRDAIKAVAHLVKSGPGIVRDLAGSPWGDLMVKMGRNVVDGGFRGWVNDKIPGPGPMAKLFDTGGYLAPGMTGVNLSSSPEPVLTGDQWRILRAAAGLDGTGGRGFDADAVDRIVKAIRDNRGLSVTVTTRDELEQAFALLERELRK